MLEDVILSEAEAEDFFVKYLQNKGYIVCLHCNRGDIPKTCERCIFKDGGFRGKRHGIDIVARKRDECIIMEIKGSNYKNQASFGVDFLTVLGQILLDMKYFDENIKYVIGIPYHKYYRTSLIRLLESKVLGRLGLHLMLIIKRDGKMDVLEVEERVLS